MTLEIVNKIAKKYNKQIGGDHELVIDGINNRNGHCPCMINEGKDTVCPCKNFRTTRECHCGLFV